LLIGSINGYNDDDDDDDEDDDGSTERATMQLVILDTLSL